MPKLVFQQGIEEASAERTQLPKGWYKGHLINSYFQDFKNGNGVALVFAFTVDHNGASRRVRSFNTWRHNSSTEAEKWGQVAGKQFFRACGKAGSESTEECHNVPLEILIHEGPKYNEVKGYRKLAQGAPPITKAMRPPGESQPPTLSTMRDDPTPEDLAKHAGKYDDDDIPF